MVLIAGSADSSPDQQMPGGCGELELAAGTLELDRITDGGRRRPGRTRAVSVHKDVQVELAGARIGAPDRVAPLDPPTVVAAQEHFDVLRRPHRDIDHAVAADGDAAHAWCQLGDADHSR